MTNKYAALVEWLTGQATDSVLLTFGRIESIVGFELPKSYRMYPAAWAAGSSLGSQLRMAGWASYLRAGNGGVLFEDVGGAAARPVHQSEFITSLNKPSDVILVGCVSRKLDTAAQAKDLYISPLWKFRRAYAEMSKKPWMILSAEHGLLRPEDRIDPYDVALRNLSTDAKSVWANRTFEQMTAEFGDLTGLRIEIHAGSPYVDTGLGESITRGGATVVRPLANLRFGEQLAWYKEYLGDQISDSMIEEFVEQSEEEDQPASLVDATYVVERLVSDFYESRLDLTERSDIPGQGWAAMPECGVVTQINSEGASAEDVRTFLTFGAAMDRARDAYRLWNMMLNLWTSDRSFFQPSEIIRMSLTELRDGLAFAGVSQRHSADAAAWRIIAESLADCCCPPVNRLITDGAGETEELLNAVKSSNSNRQPYFPLLRGPKIAHLWIRMLANPGGAAIHGLEMLPVAVDVQVRKVTEYLGVTRTYETSLESARPLIQDAWFAAVRDASMVGPDDLVGTCAALDPALWFFGKWGCTFCQRAGKRIPISSVCKQCKFDELHP